MILQASTLYSKGAHNLLLPSQAKHGEKDIFSDSEASFNPLSRPGSPIRVSITDEKGNKFKDDVERKHDSKNTKSEKVANPY